MTNKDIKLKGLFLDDERVPQDVTWIKYPNNIEWVVVRNMGEFADHIHDLSFDVYSFDHDLQDYWEIKEGQVIGHDIDGAVYATETTAGENTGYTILQSMLYDWQMLFNFEPKHLDNVKFFFHTQNPIGKKNMESYYQNYVKFIKEQN